MVAWLHGDGQYAPESLPTLLAPLDANRADVVQGSRFRGGGALRGGMPVYKYVANRGLTWMENRVFGLRLAEYHSGYMLYRRAALEAIPFRSFTTRGFVFDQEMLVAARILGLRVVDLPIPTRYAGERSYLRPIPYGIAVLKLMGRYLRGDYHRLVAPPPLRAPVASRPPGDQPPQRRRGPLQRERLELEAEPSRGSPTMSARLRGPSASSAVPRAAPFTPTKTWDSRK